jgi:hypothetical protein
MYRCSIYMYYGHIHQLRQHKHMSLYALLHVCMWINIRPRIHVYYLLTYSVALVRKRTIPIERPPLVGEVSANLCG